MADLGVTKTHSRPYVSDDNPYSESQFRTLKYRPSSPTVWAASRTAARSANSFSTGITKGIAIPASGCSPLRWSTSAKLRRSWRADKRCSTPHTRHTQTASFGDRPNRCHCPRRFGSTSRSHRAAAQQYRKLKTLLNPLDKLSKTILRHQAKLAESKQQD